MGFCTLISFVFITLGSCLVFQTSGSSASKPNIIFILADDAGWNDFSFHGSPQIPTPNIDALAFGGAVLNRIPGIVLGMNCGNLIVWEGEGVDVEKLSMTNIITQLLCFTIVHSISWSYFDRKIPNTCLQHYVIIGDAASGLPLSEKLLPEYLKELGYATHLVGKWHLGHATEAFSPTFRGFDSHFGYWLGSQDYYDHTSTDSGYWGYDFRNNMNVDHQYFGIYNTDLFTNESVRVIRQHLVEQPLFLMVTHTAPHTGNEYNPLQAPQENIDKFRDSISDENRRAYAAMVDKLDESVGLIVSALADKGMLENSIIVFASDNGGAPEGFNMNYGSNWPLRGVKNTLWEGGTRVAACIWSADIQNRVSDDLMHASDWLPTLYYAAGGNITELRNIDGVSLWNTLTTGDPSPRNTMLYNIDDMYNNSAVRYQSWKLIQGNTSTNDLGGGLWDGWYGYYNQNVTVSELLPQILSSNVAAAFETVGRSLVRDTVEKLQLLADVNCDNSIPEISCDPYSGPCLFNVVNDPCEKRNLVKENVVMVEELIRILQSFNDTAQKPIDLSHHPEAAPYLWDFTWTNWKDYV